MSPAHVAALGYALSDLGFAFAEDRITAALPTGADSDPLGLLEELADALRVS